MSIQISDAYTFTTCKVLQKLPFIIFLPKKKTKTFVFKIFKFLQMAQPSEKHQDNSHVSSHDRNKHNQDLHPLLKIRIDHIYWKTSLTFQENHK